MPEPRFQIGSKVEPRNPMVERFFRKMNWPPTPIHGYTVKRIWLGCSDYNVEVFEMRDVSIAQSNFKFAGSPDEYDAVAQPAVEKKAEPEPASSSSVFDEVDDIDNSPPSVY